MKRIVVLVPENKKDEIINANKKFNVPLFFVNSVLEIENYMEGFVIFYPPLVVNNDEFISLIKKYPTGTFNPLCDLYAFDFKTTTMLLNFENLIPHNPNIAEVLIRRFLGMKILK